MKRRLKKQQRPIFTLLHECTRYVPTAEDWYPSFFPDTAPMVVGSVRLYQTSLDRWSLRISFWGNDDTFIGRWINFDNSEAGHEQYLRSMAWLCNLAIAQRKQLEQLGFNYD